MEHKNEALKIIAQRIPLSLNILLVNKTFSTVKPCVLQKIRIDDIVESDAVNLLEWGVMNMGSNIISNEILQHTLLKVVKSGCVGLFEWFFTTLKDWYIEHNEKTIIFSTEMCKQYFSLLMINNNIELIKVAVKCLSNNKQLYILYDTIARSHKWSLMQWMCENYYLSREKLMNYAVMHDKPDILEWAVSFAKITWKQSTVDEVTMQGNIPMLNHILKNNKNKIVIKASKALVAKEKSTQVFEWAMMNKLLVWDRQGLTDPSIFQNLDFIQQCVKYHCEWPDTLFCLVEKSEQYEILKYIIENGCKIDYKVIRHIIMTGNLTRFKNVLHCGVPFQAFMISLAKTYNHTHFLDYMIEQGFYDSTLETKSKEEAHESAKTFLEAVKSDDVIMVKDVITHGRHLSYYKYVITLAAEHGSLSVMKYFVSEFQNFPQFRWPKNTTALAARNGSIDMIKWLRKQGCPWSGKTTAEAAKANRKDIIELCLLNGGILHKDTLAYAVCNDNLDLFKWLLKNKCQWSPHVSINAARNASINILKFINWHRVFKQNINRHCVSLLLSNVNVTDEIKQCAKEIAQTKMICW